jgi:translation elongation factor EF-4
VTADSINICIGIISENLPKTSSKTQDSMNDYLERIIKYIKRRKEQNAEGFSEVII